MNELRAKVRALHTSGMDPDMVVDLIIDVVARGLGKLGGRPEVSAEEKAVRQNIPTSVRFRVFERDGFKCKYCGRSRERGATLVVDHVIPVAKGGRNTVGNLVTACDSCNHGKSDRLLLEGEPTSELMPQPQEQPVELVVAASKSVEPVSGSESSLDLFPESGSSSQQSGLDRRSNEPLPPGFGDFWAVYPRRVGKSDALRAWKKHRPDIEVVRTALVWQIEAWDSESPPRPIEKIPHPATWINGRRWEDERPVRRLSGGSGPGGAPSRIDIEQKQQMIRAAQRRGGGTP